MRNSSAAVYRYLPFAVFIFFTLSFILHPESPLRNGQLLDTDDYMRLNEVINWLQSAHPLGAGWFDLSHPRLDPGHTAIVHWARLVDLPIALCMLPFIHAFGMQSAALIASFIVPPLLFIVLLMLMPALARPLIDPPRHSLTAVFLLFAPAVLMNFSPGRVDHHGWNIIIAAFGLLCLERMITLPSGWCYGIYAAISYACGLWIGTEALPWLVLFCACLGLVSAWRGRFALRNAGIFGLALPVAVALIMPLALSPSQYLTRDLSWFSGADLIFAALAGSVFILSWGFEKLRCRETNSQQCSSPLLSAEALAKADAGEDRWGGGSTRAGVGSRGENPTPDPARKGRGTLLRIMLMFALGFFASALFVYFVPDILTGAYADYDAFFNETLINNIGETQPLVDAMRINIYNPVTFWHALVVFLHSAFLPCLASIIVIVNLFRGTPRRRMIWLMHGFFLLPALLMTLFWQVRIGWFAQIFSIVPMTWLAVRLWEKIGTHFKDRQKFWAEIAAFILIAPLPVILLPAIIGEAKIYPDLLLFPATRAAPACPLLRASEFLNDKYGDPPSPNGSGVASKPRLILSGDNEGPELLFRTKHKVLAAPYDIEGNKDAFDFFNTRRNARAYAIAQKRHADLVLVCRAIPLFYAGLGDYHSRFNAHFYMDKQGRLSITSSRDHPTMIERLDNGQPPEWLKPVEIPGDRDYLLFEVQK